MATNDVILIRRNGSNIWTETILSSTADYVLGFDGSGNVVAKPLPALAAHETTHRSGGSDPLPWGSLIHASGLFAARPAASASNAGYLYFSTDTGGGTVFRSDGATWTAITLGMTTVPLLASNNTFTGTNTFSDDVVLGAGIQADSGGNARGADSVDFQRSRSSASYVASGYLSFLGPGESNTASGDLSAVLGGQDNTASGYVSAVLNGFFGVAHLLGQLVSGCAQYFQHTLSLKPYNTTTNATPTQLFLDGSSNRITVPSGQTWGFIVKIVGRQSGGGNHAFYIRQGVIDNTGGTTQIRGSIHTIGIDTETNAAWNVAITADNTNDALIITVTGADATDIRWLATLDITQVTYT